MSSPELKINSGDVRALATHFNTTGSSLTDIVKELHSKHQTMEPSLDTQSYAALDASMQAVLKAQNEMTMALAAHAGTLNKVADIVDQTSEQLRQAFSSLHQQ